MNWWKVSFAGILVSTLVGCSSARAYESVVVKDNQLYLDGQAQPQLFGAEVQYFRLRGGYGRNIPRAKVIALWNKTLDRVVEAKMNAISFYIPWDFHEYAEGKFDFTGTADEDGDGNPDYPSRDLVTFLKLVQNHGIKRILIRPGPYINAEWGFLGFGAVPLWFHNKFPESHMHSPDGLRTKPIDYFDPNFLEYTRRWFTALTEQVLKPYLGKGGPVAFLQLDNETNYQWTSIYNHDYGTRAVGRYQKFLQKSYGSDLAKLNQTHQRQWNQWADIKPPVTYGKNVAEDQDWYRFADHSMFEYLQKIRQMWEALGIHEPQVMFTSAESYNAPEHGVIPNYVLRNASGKTGLLTVNLYPKTFEPDNHSILNAPFKADLDVKSEAAANAAYFGQSQQWVMGPEIQAGWWRGIDVNDKSRQQTYLSVLGHGLKAFFVYYFNEGENWQVEWAAESVRPCFDELKKELNLGATSIDQLPDSFWDELQNRVDHGIVTGLDVRQLMKEDPYFGSQELYFDSPLDADANPRDHFFLLKKLGENVISPFGDFLGQAVEVTDDVAFVKDSSQHVPSPVAGLDSLQVSADDSGSLVGYFLNEGVNPQILHGDISSDKDFASPKMLVHLDTGVSAPRTEYLLKKAFERGQGVVNMLSDKTAKDLGFKFPQSDILMQSRLTQKLKEQKLHKKLSDPRELSFYLDGQGLLVSAAAPGVHEVKVDISQGDLFVYDLGQDQRCKPILFYQGQTAGYRCKKGGRVFYQLGALMADDYNSSDYGQINDVPQRQSFLRALLSETGAHGHLHFTQSAGQVAAFARINPKQKGFVWVTVKSGAMSPRSQKLRLDCTFAKSWLLGDTLRVKELMTDQTQKLSVDEICQTGFQVNLGSEESAVYAIQALNF